MAKHALDHAVLVNITKAERDAWHRAVKRAGFDTLSGWIRTIVRKEIKVLDAAG